MGIAGLGAALEHSRPIFEGCFSPDGLGRVVGLACSGPLGIVDAVVLIEALSDEVDDGAGGGKPMSVPPSLDNSCSLIFLFSRSLFN